MSLDPLRENCQTRFWNSKKNNQPCWDVDRSLRACVQAVCLERALEYFPLVSWGQGDAVEFSVQERSKYFRWVPRLDFLKQQPPPVNKLFKEKKKSASSSGASFFVQGRARHASGWWRNARVHGKENKWAAKTSRPFSPSRLSLRANFHRVRETSYYTWLVTSEWLIVCYKAVFSVITQRFSPQEERCVTTLKAAV